MYEIVQFERGVEALVLPKSTSLRNQSTSCPRSRDLNRVARHDIQNDYMEIYAVKNGGVRCKINR
jgi:hypothetical protein